MTHLRAISVTIATVLLSGCGMTEDYVRGQVQQTESRIGVRIDQVDADSRNRDVEVANRSDQRTQAVAGEISRLRADLTAESEARRRMVVDALARQREAVAAQLRSLDDALAALSAPPSAPTALLGPAPLR